MIVFCLPLLTSCLEQGLDQTFSTDLQPWASPWFPLFQKTASPPNIHWQDSPWLVNLEVTSNSVSLPTASDSSSHWSCVFISFFTGTLTFSLFFPCSLSPHPWLTTALSELSLCAKCHHNFCHFHKSHVFYFLSISFLLGSLGLSGNTRDIVTLKYSLCFSDILAYIPIKKFFIYVVL